MLRFTWRLRTSYAPSLLTRSSQRVSLLSFPHLSLVPAKDFFPITLTGMACSRYPCWDHIIPPSEPYPTHLPQCSIQLEEHVVESGGGGRWGAGGNRAVRSCWGEGITAQQLVCQLTGSNQSRSLLRHTWSQRQIFDLQPQEGWESRELKKWHRHVSAPLLILSVINRLF